MLNYIWAFMILVGIVYGSITGNIAAVSNAALDSAKEAVTLCITMLGIMSMWTGLMEVARSAGMIEAAVNKCDRILKFLFPRIPRSHPAREYIATNMIANILGLGWAATPAGLKAMEALSDLEKERTGTTSAAASTEMCTFLILNISSLQLIPVNMIAYRSQYGSPNPAAIIAPAIAATLFSSLVAVIFCKLKAAKP
ncbi:MAG: nucleoside recognition protein [Lachnospiraceae bacterium]|nr:nucleoside recognition protein [Lachnospiraceae bacterium]